LICFALAYRFIFGLNANSRHFIILNFAKLFRSLDHVISFLID